jgi:hypothetical protein
MTDQEVIHKLIASVVGDKCIYYAIRGTGVNARISTEDC